MPQTISGTEYAPRRSAHISLPCHLAARFRYAMTPASPRLSLARCAVFSLYLDYSMFPQPGFLLATYPTIHNMLYLLQFQPNLSLESGR